MLEKTSKITRADPVRSDLFFLLGGKIPNHNMQISNNIQTTNSNEQNILMRSLNGMMISTIATCAAAIPNA